MSPGIQFTETVAARGYHCLRSRWVRPPIQNWHAFLTRWQSATTHQELRSLLHEGYTLSLIRSCRDERNYDENERHVFYLTIADGWDGSDFPSDGNCEYFVGYDQNGRSIRLGPVDLCRDLATKAFNQLAINFFKRMEEPGSIHNREGLEKNRAWEQLIASDHLLDTIQNFFRIEAGVYQEMVIRNLSGHSDRRSHQEEAAVTFLLNFARFVWQWQEPGISCFETPEQEEKLRARFSMAQSRIEIAKPWLIEILNCLDQLDSILSKHILELSRPCLDKLMEISLRSWFRASRHSQLVGNDRQAVNLDEACYLGSKAAWFLKRHDIMAGVHGRLSQIRQAELALAEAQEEVQRLAAASKR